MYLNVGIIWLFSVSLNYQRCRWIPFSPLAPLCGKWWNFVLRHIVYVFAWWPRALTPSNHRENFHLMCNGFKLRLIYYYLLCGWVPRGSRQAKHYSWSRWLPIRDDLGQPKKFNNVVWFVIGSLLKSYWQPVKRTSGLKWNERIRTQYLSATLAPAP